MNRALGLSMAVTVTVYTLLAELLVTVYCTGSVKSCGTPEAGEMVALTLMVMVGTRALMPSDLGTKAVMVLASWSMVPV